MYIHGQFINKKGNIITLEILSKGDRTEEKIIGSEDSGIYFQDDPIEIANEMNDTFDHLLRHSCTIRLLCRDYIRDFYNTSCRDTIVNVLRDDTILFAGYIEPLTFSQGYNYEYDEVEINCIDILSALQYSRYMPIGASITAYENLKKQAKQRTFMQILESILYSTTADTIISKDIDASNAVHIYYDDSKAISEKETTQSIWDNISISELLFLEGNDDKAWARDAVIEEIMRYLDLHIVQEGATYYIYAWETLRQSDNTSIIWKDLVHNQSTTISSRDTIDISLDIVADDDTQINIDETYNKLTLKSSTTSMENLIRSPLDKDDLTSPFTGKQLYMQEIVSPGSTKTPRAAFKKAYFNAEPTDWGKAYIADWYVRIMDNDKWTFYPRIVQDADMDSHFPYSGDNRYQNALLDAMGRGNGTALLKVGRITKTLSRGDASFKSKVDMEDCLAITIHGMNGVGGINAPNQCLMSMIPCATYEDRAEAGVYSPSDEETTNYIVISGKIAYNPIRDLSFPVNNPPSDFDSVESVKGRDGNEFYAQRFFKAITPNSEPELNEKANMGFIPYSDKAPQYYKYEPEEIGATSVSKLPVLICMLVIGDKCLVEKEKGETFVDGDAPGTGQGAITDYVWREYKSREECTDDKEYYSQSFSIGFTPKSGDYFVGAEFDIQNNISVQMNLDVEGTAISMKKSDKLKGAIKFSILCPAQAIYFVRTAYALPPWKAPDTVDSFSSRYLLRSVDSIIIKDFEMKLYSDNGKYETIDENDIIYTSDTDESFINEKDDLEFKITSALTAKESYAIGVKTDLNLSTPFNTQTDGQLLEIYDRNTQETAKPEQHYVANHYIDCHVPRVTMEQNLEDENTNVSIVNRYRHPAMNKEFWVTGISRNLMEGTASMSLREI